MNKKLAVLYSLAVSLLSPAIVFAANPTPCLTSSIGTWFSCIINNLLNVVVWYVFVGLVVAMFLWAGILFLTARGEPGKIETAKKAIERAVEVLAVGLLAFSAVATIKWVLGIT